MLNNILSTYTESLMVNGALSVIDELFVKYNIIPNNVSYNHLLRMHLRKKNVDEALTIMDTMRSNAITPMADSWGMIIDAFASRNQPIEALKIIDEIAKTSPNIISIIPNSYLTRIRLLCRKLAVAHPLVPVDPDEWMRDVKEQRRKMKLVSKSKIQPLRSLLYT